MKGKSLAMDAVNNARQMSLMLLDWRTMTKDAIDKCVIGIDKRLDNLAEIIDNGAVEDDI